MRGLKFEVMPASVLSLGMGGGGEPDSGSLLAFLILITPFPKVTFPASPLTPRFTSLFKRRLFRQLVNNDALGCFNRGKETCRGSYLG